MSSVTLPFSSPGCSLTQISLTGTTLPVAAHATSRSARCVHCDQLAKRVHSRYIRSPHDLPISNQPVQLQLHGRRFPDVVGMRAQRTTRLACTLQTLAVTLGGEASARVVALLHMAASADTLLHLIRQASVSRAGGR